MYGVLRVVKPPGMTSHDVVEFVRRQWETKVGHTGTLDPAAAGLLVLCVGPATRLSEYLAGSDKTYRAEITLGLSTTTYDAEGTVTRQCSAVHIQPQRIREGLAELTGPIQMQVPAYSAVRHEGEKLYKRARRGEKQPALIRQVQIYHWELVDFAECEHPRALTEVKCSKGTYVRSLAVELGERLGTGGYLSFLVRTQVGSHCLADAFTLEQLAELTSEELAQTALIPPAEAVSHLPRLTVTAPVASRLQHGIVQQVEPASAQAPRRAAILTDDQELLCIAEVSASGGCWRLQPRTVFNWPNQS